MICQHKTLDEYISIFSKFAFGSLELIIDSNTNKVCWTNNSIKNRPLARGINLEQFENCLSTVEDNVACLSKIFQTLKDRHVSDSLFITKLKHNKKIIYSKIYPNLIYSSDTKELLGCYCVINFIHNFSPVIHFSLKFKSSGSSIVVLDNQNYNSFTNCLNQREHEIITLLAMHKSHKEISIILSDIHQKDISPAAITTTISRSLYSKLEVNNTSNLLFKAVELGVLDFIPSSLLNTEM